MIDVHAPHGATHTWTDFFIHVGTIAVGLLLAIGLEQTVELFHHHHQVAETRRALQEEKQENIRIFHENVERHVMAMGYLHNNLRIFQFLRDHPRTAQDKLPGILYWGIFSTRPQETAWSTAEHTDVLSLMPRKEVSDISAVYNNIDYAWQQYEPVIEALTQSTAYFSQTPDITRLSTADIDEEINNLKLAIAREAVYGDTLSLVGRQPGFGPTPSWWQMLPFFTMQDYYRWARQHPELNGPSQKNIDEARAHAGLPPERPNQSFDYYTAPNH
jgi:hypothetical protein